MMKILILASRRTGISHGEFRRYVTEIHGPLVKRRPRSSTRYQPFSIAPPCRSDLQIGAASR
jgi:hypothetical protein